MGPAPAGPTILWNHRWEYDKAPETFFEALEALDASRLRSSALGPVLLALLAQFHFFKTGHQAALSSIQWESAFVPLRAVTYPWSPLLVAANTFAPLILSAIAVPVLALWKIPPRTAAREILERVAADLAVFMAVFAAWNLATVVEAAWLRRHLMLWWTVGSVGDVFGWG